MRLHGILVYTTTSQGAAANSPERWPSFTYILYLDEGQVYLDEGQVYLDEGQVYLDGNTDYPEAGPLPPFSTT